MSVLLQMSDPHFGTEQAPVVDALLKLAEAERPEVTVWSGDITQRAQRSQFEAARAFFDRLATQHQLVIPGNHDIPLFNLPARLFTHYANYSRAFGPTLEPTLSTADWLVIGVNTTRPWRHKNGEVSNAQLDRVASKLRQARAGQVRVVVVHQPLCVTLEKDRQNLLRGAPAALSRWGEAGVDLVLGGHIHLPYMVPVVNRHTAGGGPFWVVQAGTALSSRTRGDTANSVNLIRSPAGPGQAIMVERWDFEARTARFNLVSQSACVPTNR